jgi:outer membrane lipoprotein-sorting protein
VILVRLQYSSAFSLHFDSSSPTCDPIFVVWPIFGVRKLSVLEDLLMDGRAVLSTLLVLVALSAGAPAQDAKRSDQLESGQVALIQRVNAYFNQVSSLKGAFVQTSANSKQLRGKFYVQRPGRFRLDYAPPSKLVIVSDGQNVAIQDNDLKTDDRWELDQTPFGVLLRKDVDLLRDARLFEVQETDDTIVVVFESKSSQTSGPIKLFLANGPTLELKKWITKDLQGRDTQIEVSDLVRVDELRPDLFKLVAVALERLR